MKQLKKLFALLLVLCMVFTLCACGGDNETKEDSQKDNLENSQVKEDESTEKEDEEEEKPVFQVKVVDAEGNAVENVMLQVCKDACVPAKTDASGIATFNLEIAEEGYKLSVLSCPEGYTYTGEAEVYLEAGITEYTLELK